MGYRIIESKLVMPQLGKNHINRPDLYHSFDEASFVLVSAPAGSGKSALVTDWLRHSQDQIVWYALDEWDSDFQIFMQYLIEGLRPFAPETSESCAELLLGYKAMGDRSIIRAMAIELRAIDKPFILVLDDYHLVRDQSIDTLLTMLVEHCSDKIQILVLTREDPNFPLSKWRLKGSMTEIRANDLRFNSQDVSRLIENQLKQPLNKEIIERLTERTDGWIAGLNLAILSMEKSDNPQAFIDQFSGNHFYIVDYLVEEVLNQLDQTMQTFLLKVSVLDFFDSQSCEAIRIESQDTLLQAIQQNLFVIPLSGNQGSFRLHHLLKDLMYERLKHHDQFDFKRLHQAAGHYYKDKGIWVEALRQFERAKDYMAYASVLEPKWAEMDDALESSLWLSYALKLPVSVSEKLPVMSLGIAFAYIDSADFESARGWIERANQAYEAFESGDEDYTVFDLKQLALFNATMASAMGFMAAARGDLENLFHYAHMGLENIPDQQYYKRGVVSMMLAFAHWQMGELDKATQIIKEAIRDVEKEVNYLTLYSFHMVLITVFIQQGKIKTAEYMTLQVLEVIEEKPSIAILKATMLLFLGQIYLLKGDKAQAKRYLSESRKASERMSIMDYPYKYNLTMAWLYSLEGEYKLAYDMIKTGKETYYLNPMPDWLSIEAVENYTHIHAKHSNLVDVSDMTYEGFLSESTLLNQVMIDIQGGKGQHDKALVQLDEGLIVSHNQNRVWSEICLMVMKGRILLDMNQVKLGNDILHQALALANEESLMLAFEMYLSEDLAGQFIQIEKADLKKELANQALIEPLTQRELEVLGLIVEGLSNQEISDTLFLALSTVKGYIQNIYGKLEVKRRTEAVQKARSTGLVD